MAINYFANKPMPTLPNPFVEQEQTAPKKQQGRFGDVVDNLQGIGYDIAGGVSDMLGAEGFGASLYRGSGAGAGAILVLPLTAANTVLVFAGDKAVLELGGSDPFVVLDSDDVSGIAEAAWGFRIDNTGQACNSNKRMIVILVRPPSCLRILGTFSKMKCCGLLTRKMSCTLKKRLP